MWTIKKLNSLLCWYMFKWKVDLGRKIRLERGSCVLVNGIKGYFDGKKKKKDVKDTPKDCLS